MSSRPFQEPRLFVARTEELHFSGPALLDLLRAVLARGVPFRFRAKGWSMSPFILDGDVLTVAPLAGAPSVGDVVAFTRPDAGSLVVHRVVDKCAGGWLIQGDEDSGCTDGVVPPASLLGRVTRVERAGRAVRLGIGPEKRAIAWLSRTRRLGLFRGWMPGRLKEMLR